MAKQKPAQGKKLTKAKPERPGSAKAVAVSNQKPAVPAKAAVKPAPTPVVSSPKKKPNASAPAVAPKKNQTSKPASGKPATIKPVVSKPAVNKPAAKTVAKLRDVPAAKVAVTRKPPENAGKAVARPAANVTIKREEPAKAGKTTPPAPKAKTVAKPDIAKPAVTKPIVGKQVVGKQIVAKPVAAKPTAAKPAVSARTASPPKGAATSPKGAATKSAAPGLKPPGPRIVGNGQLAGVLQAARSVASRTTKVVEVEKERKSHLTEEELAEFRQILLDKRRELVDDMVNLEDEARRTGSDGGSGASAMPIHMADLGTDTWEQEFTLNLIEKERTIVREIDEALDRIEKKTYGTCLATGKSISKARLRVKPWAKYCIEYARKRELGLA